jgi:hypothetical protein
MQAARYGSLLHRQQLQQQQEQELRGVCETRAATAAAAAAGLRMSSASPVKANTTWHSTTSFTAQQQQQLHEQQWRPSSAAAAAGQHARMYWGSMPGYASSSHCSQAGAADTPAVAAQQQPCTRQVPLRPLASPAHVGSDAGVAGSLSAHTNISCSEGGGAGTGVVPPAERYAALVAGADAALRQLAECRRAAAAHGAGSPCAAFGGSRSGISGAFAPSDPASQRQGVTERAYVHRAPADMTTSRPGQLESSSAAPSKYTQVQSHTSYTAAAAAAAAAVAAGAGVGQAADSSSTSSRWHELQEVRQRATGNSTADARAAAGAGVDVSVIDSGSSSVRWHELRAELQAMDGDLDAAEAALQAATARLGSKPK